MNQDKRDKYLQEDFKELAETYAEFKALILSHIMAERIKRVHWDFARTSTKMKELTAKIKELSDNFYTDKLMPKLKTIYKKEFERAVEEIEEMIEGEMLPVDVEKILSEDVSVDGLTLEEREKKNHDAFLLVLIGALRQSAGDDGKFLDLYGAKGIEKLFENHLVRNVKRGLTTQVTRMEWLAMREMDEQNQEGEIYFQPGRGKQLEWAYYCEKDGLVCDTCKEFEGMRFTRFSDAPELPQHPNCRCWYGVYRYLD